MPGRGQSLDYYRFSFNGKEADTETGLQDYGFRVYDRSISRFLSVDPLAPDYPWYTPYQFAGNKPIGAVDLDGLEEFAVIQWRGWTKVILTNPKAPPSVNYYKSYGVNDFMAWLTATPKSSVFQRNEKGGLPFSIRTPLQKRAFFSPQGIVLKTNLPSYRESGYKTYVDHNGGIGFPTMPELTEVNPENPDLLTISSELKRIPLLPTPETSRTPNPLHHINRSASNGYDWYPGSGELTPTLGGNNSFQVFVNSLIPQLNANSQIRSITIDLLEAIESDASDEQVQQHRNGLNNAFNEMVNVLKGAGLRNDIRILRGNINVARTRLPEGHSLTGMGTTLRFY